MGGEHTVTYYSLRPLAKIKPIVIHFDAHRDMKPEYNGMKKSVILLLFII